MIKFEIRLQLADRWLMERLGKLTGGNATSVITPAKIRFESECESAVATERAVMLADGLIEDLKYRGFHIRDFVLYRMEISPATGEETLPMPVRDWSCRQPATLYPSDISGWQVPAPIPFEMPNKSKWAKATIGRIEE